MAARRPTAKFSDFRIVPNRLPGGGKVNGRELAAVKKLIDDAAKARSTLEAGIRDEDRVLVVDDKPGQKPMKPSTGRTPKRRTSMRKLDTDLLPGSISVKKLFDVI
jgi:hypothetical protein